MEKKVGLMFLILVVLIAGYISIYPGESSINPSEASLSVDPNVNGNSLVIVLSFDYEDTINNIGTENLPHIFQILERHNAKATFFVLGRTAEANPDAIKEVYSRGYSFGLHTWTHNFPIFTRHDAIAVEKIYKVQSDYVWDRSFKTSEAFYGDIVKNKKSVQSAVGEGIDLKMFRSPSLVINWTVDPLYFSTLKEAGIEIDSSFLRAYTDKRPFYNIHGIVEVPVSVSETRLSDVSHLNKIAGRYSRDRIPFVMYIHPQKLTPRDFTTLDDFLSSLEEEYDVTYLKLDEVPTYYGMS